MSFPMHLLLTFMSTAPNLHFLLPALATSPNGDVLSLLLTHDFEAVFKTINTNNELPKQTKKVQAQTSKVPKIGVGVK